MLLAVDVGNTNIVGGLYEGTTLVDTFRLATERGRTVDEYAVLVAQVLSLRNIAPTNVSSCIVASVVPQVTGLITSAITQVARVTPLVVGGPGLKTGMSIRYDNPREVGADRIVNAVAAYAKVHAAVIVVDFGTATTFDCISEQGEYLGGVIVPGVQVSLDGLLSRAAKLSRVELTEPPRVIGRNTPHAMQSGIIYGYASLVDGLLHKIENEMGVPCRTLATGGLAEHICAHTERVEEVCPNLTLDGLRLIYERNRQDPPR
jgi:type III pantothenate kinase